jgi:predicted O-methyltransferase YrrM
LSVKSIVKRAIGRVSSQIAQAHTVELKQTRDVDLVVAALLARTDLTLLNDAVAYAADLRSCIEPLRMNVTRMKRPAGPPSEADKRFDSYAELLAAKLPPAPMALALTFARVADAYRGSHSVVKSGDWAADVARHFAVSSSSGRKGRLLASAVAHFAPHLILELGTAYGISGLFMTQTFASLQTDRPRKLVTVEGFEPQATLSRTMLSRESPGLAEFEVGLSTAALPRLARTLDGIDFYFHDAGHTYDDYVNDVGIMLPKMASGSILFLDDIRWDDRRYVSQPSRAYEGWQSIVANPRTRAAFEVDGELGVAMFE